MGQTIKSTNNKIDALVFDSGAGGATICAAILAYCPSARLCFASDNAAFPYGGKSEDEILARVESTLLLWRARHEPRVIVIACNTASTLALEFMRARIDIPVVGVVPAIKPAAKLSKNRAIALLATEKTIVNSYTENLIERYASGCRVERLASGRLVEIAELQAQGKAPSKSELCDILMPLASSAPVLDTVVLGCTHFPLLKKELMLASREILPNIINWVDSGEAIARRVATLLPDLSQRKQPQTQVTEPQLELSNSSAVSSAQRKRLIAIALGQHQRRRPEPVEGKPAP